MTSPGGLGFSPSRPPYSLASAMHLCLVWFEKRNTKKKYTIEKKCMYKTKVWKKCVNFIQRCLIRENRSKNKDPNMLAWSITVNLELCCHRSQDICVPFLKGGRWQNHASHILVPNFAGTEQRTVVWPVLVHPL